MNYENEITVEIALDLDSLIKLIESKGFKLKEIYDLYDIYLINKNDRHGDYLSMLNRSVLIRNIIRENKDLKLLTYKYKEYNEQKEIIKQGKVEVEIDNINNTRILFEKINFEQLTKINDHALVYATDTDELVIQVVNNKHIYIEIESKCHYTDRVYNSVDEMKDVIINNAIPIKNNDYFVKKVEVELHETYDNGSE